MRLGALVVLLPLLLSGCAGSHYYQEKEGVVSFYFRQPEATEVLLACSLDHFQPHPAERDRGGNWKVEIRASRDFRYFYLVDGEVVAPECPLSETDDFGARNCLYVEQRSPADAPLGQEVKSAAAAAGSD